MLLNLKISMKRYLKLYKSQKPSLKDPAIPLMQKSKPLIRFEKTYASVSTSTEALFTRATMWKQPKRPAAGDWMEKGGKTRGGPLSCICDSTGLDGIMLRKISQEEKDKYPVISLTRGS